MVLVLLCTASAQAQAGEVQLLWDRNTEADLAGYVVLVGTAKGVYTRTFEVGPAATQALVTDLAAGTTYYFATRAFNTAGLRSGLSNEVVVTLPGAAVPPAVPGAAVPPAVTAVSPAWGPTAGGTVLTITGSNFLTGATVLLGTTPAVVTSVKPTVITATAPAHGAGLLSVAVVNPGGGRSTKADAFTYRALAPTIASVTPNRGSAVGGNAVVVTGQNFAAGTAVTFDGLAATVLAVSPTALEVRVPKHAVGRVVVSVRNADGQTVNLANGYRYEAVAPSITDVTPGTGPTDGGTLATITGANFVRGAKVSFNDVAAQVLSVSPTQIQVSTPANTEGLSDVKVVNPNGFEYRLAKAFRYDDGDQDPTYIRYFAEGVQGDFFETRFALANPHSEPVWVEAIFTDPFGQETAMEFTVPAGSRRTLDRTNMPKLTNEAFGSRFKADREIGIDRTVVWDPAGRYGAHSETGIETPRTEWYLAEGATHSGFNVFYLLQNPTETVAEVLVRYLLGSGTVIEKVHYVGARSRTNIWVNKDDPALEAAEMSAHLISVNDVPIVVERSMYLNTGNRLFTAGHNSAGVTDPATRWFLAEGATGEYFDSFILIANPSTTPAALEVTYLLPTGAPLVLPYVVPANSRYTIWVDQQHPQLAATDFSAVVESTNGVPLIVERTMWWPDRPGGQWIEAHNSAGATTTAARWLMADGESSAANGTTTYGLVANTSNSATTVRFTLLGENGVVRSVLQTVGGNARFSIDVAGTFPEALNRRFGLLVESVDGAPLVVERATYWDAGGIRWSAGINSLATPLRHVSGAQGLPTHD